AAKEAYLAALPIPQPPPLPPPQVLPQVAAEQQPVHITIHNYIIVPDDPPAEPRERPTRQNRRPQERPPEAPVVWQQPVVTPPPPPVVTVHPPAEVHHPVPAIVVLPRLPNADSNRVYRIQVGAFQHDGTLEDAQTRLAATGFPWTAEQRGDLVALIVENVHSTQMNNRIRSLASAGFRQVWIWEPQQP
ncbi:MAG: hypothetical protein FWD88_05070, partial [Treponema sp.]|nr:hypothetical protein [Treponema sp.]